METDASYSSGVVCIQILYHF